MSGLALNVCWSATHRARSPISGGVDLNLDHGGLRVRSAMTRSVGARRLTDAEGQSLLRIVRRGKRGTIQVRRAIIIMASSSGSTTPAIADLVAACDDTVRRVIHTFNATGLAALDPHWAGGRPRLITDADIAVIIATALTRPKKLGTPFTHWSLRKLSTYLRGGYRRTAPIRRVGCAARCLRWAGPFPRSPPPNRTCPFPSIRLSSDLLLGPVRQVRADGVVAGAADHKRLPAPLRHDPYPFGLWTGFCEICQPGDLMHIDVVRAGAHLASAVEEPSDQLPPRIGFPGRGAVFDGRPFLPLQRDPSEPCDQP